MVVKSRVHNLIFNYIGHRSDSVLVPPPPNKIKWCPMPFNVCVCLIFELNCHHFYKGPFLSLVRWGRPVMEHALLCRHRVVQHPQVCFSALSMAEVRLSSGENETTPNCSTWVGSASAGKKKTDIHKSVIFAAKYCGFQSSRICETKNYRYPFSLRVQLVKFFLPILMLKVCRL